MPDAPLSTTVLNDRAADTRSARGVIIKLLAVGALAILLLRREWQYILPQVLSETEAAHGAAIPLLIALLVYRRRHALADAVRPGSWWGLPLILLGIALYAFSTWPFNYGQPRQLSIVPIMAGGVLSIGGWRLLKLCVPMLILLCLAIPIGPRHLAALIIRPETFTLAVSEHLLGMLPGITVHLDGPDLHYKSNAADGVIALGDPNRGASLLISCITIAVFVSFIYIRPMWQLIVGVILCGPIILLCNLLRVLLHAMITIYGDYPPTSSVPRMASHAFVLVLAYCSFVLLYGVLNRIIERPEAAARSRPALDPAAETQPVRKEHSS